MKNIAERLKSPVVWSAVLTVIYAQLEMLQENGADLKSILLSLMIVLCSAFSALNDPTNRDGI